MSVPGASSAVEGESSGVEGEGAGSDGASGASSAVGEEYAGSEDDEHADNTSPLLAPSTAMATANRGRMRPM